MEVSTCWRTIIVLAAVACFLCPAQSEITILPDVLYYNITTTPRADLFHLHNQRQFAENSKEMEQRLLEFKANFNARLDVIGLHIELIETKLNEVNNKLDPLVLLGDVNDYCVHKYRTKLPTVVQMILKMKECTMKGVNALNSIINAPDVTVKNLKAYYASTQVNALNDCRKRYAGHFTEKDYQNCVSTLINNAVVKTVSDTAVFGNQMKSAECTAALKVKEVFDCYGANVFNTYKTIGEVMGLVENCIAGREFCPSCGDEDALTKGRCPYHLSWHLSDEDIKSEKITNPFKGISKTTPCLQVNFITKGVVVLQ